MPSSAPIPKRLAKIAAATYEKVTQALSADENIVS
jgi:hypothetical protein